MNLFITPLDGWQTEVDIESHYPTQAKRRLEWATQHLLCGSKSYHPELASSHADSKALVNGIGLRPD